MTETTDYPASSEVQLAEAESFIRACYEELGLSSDVTEARLEVIRSDIRDTGTYEHTYEELTHGARMAWRNAGRCIGRLFWNRMHILDARACETEDDVFLALEQHLAYATNGGEIKPVMTVFKPDRGENNRIRLWNHQLVRYAGFKTPEGPIGDPASIAFTQACEELGWRGIGTKFDLLPLVVQVDGGMPKWKELSPELAKEVPLAHPEFNLFGDEEFRWYAVPVISDMALEIGGIRYSAAPFNGWYMGTEIGARNLADEDRYNLLPQVAANLGLDTSSSSTLWKDKALVELNVAVLHSFREHGVSIVDHHTAAQQFKMFQRNESKEDRQVAGRWSWLIPPLSPATTGIFHDRFEDLQLKPCFSYQQPPYNEKKE